MVRTRYLARTFGLGQARLVPRFGELQASEVWAAATRTLTAFNAQSLFDLPALQSVYPAEDITSSAVADAFGDWVQISADIGASRRLVHLIVAQGSSDSIFSIEVEVGEGGAGNEAAVARIQLVTIAATNVGQLSVWVIPLWKSLTDNARISVRVRDDRAYARTYYAGIGVA